MTTQEQQEQEDSSSIIPALLTVAALYAAYRATKGRLEGNWRTIAVAIGIPAAVTTVFAAIAAHALDGQRKEAGRAGDELWTAQTRAVTAGVDAGVRTVVQSLRWLDSHADPTGTRDSRSGPARPTASNPPIMLAEVVVKAIANAAQIRAAELVGWRTKVWKTQRDNRVRDSHRTMQGQRRGLHEPFITGTGVRIAYPGDPTAPIEEWAACRCFLATARR